MLVIYCDTLRIFAGSFLVMNVLQGKGKGHIGPIEPLATRLQRAKKASVDQAISGVLFQPGIGRFARGVQHFGLHLPSDATGGVRRSGSAANVQ